MLWLSELLMQDHEVSSFEELKERIRERALQGELHFGMDVRPPFADPPDDWEEVLESTFYSAR